MVAIKSFYNIYPFFCWYFTSYVINVSNTGNESTSLSKISILFNTEADIRSETPNFLRYYWCIAVNVNIANMSLDTIKSLRK